MIVNALIQILAAVIVNIESIDVSIRRMSFTILRGTSGAFNVMLVCGVFC
jgi:hypothetical protein